MKLINTPKIDSVMNSNILKFIDTSLNLGNIQIEGISLGGSYTKGTSNLDSDIDLLLYYSNPFTNLIRVDPPSITLQADKVEMKEGSGTCFYNYKGAKYELSFIPVFTTTGTKKELIRNLYQQKIDYMFKFVKSIPIQSTTPLSTLRTKLLSDYNWGRDNVYGYFHGYMKSQLQRHKRRKDGQRRMLESLSKNSALPLVKLTIDGLYICLSGISMLRDEEINLSFIDLAQRYASLFTKEQNQFIQQCYERKIHRTPMDTTLNRWVSQCLDHRDDMFNILDIEIKSAADHTTLPKLTTSLRKQNAVILNNYLHNIYL